MIISTPPEPLALMIFIGNLKLNTMKIIITKNTKPQSWYKDLIGKTFNVLEVDKQNRHYIVHKGRLLNSFICFDDCTVLNEEKKCGE